MEEILRKRILRLRLIWGTAALIGLILIIVFGILYSNSREVVIIGEGTALGDWLKQESVTHDYRFAFGILAGVLFLVWGLCFEFCSLFLLCSRIDCGNDTLFLYRGFFTCELYRNEELADSLFGSFRSYLEAKLSDGSTATVTLSRWRGAHISFSNGKAPIDVP